MTATQDLFTLSFTTKADAGEDGLDFLRPDAYTAEQVLTEIHDLMVHPDNKHVEGVEVRRAGRLADAVRPELTPLSFKGSNAFAGWSGQVWTASDYEPRGFFTARHDVLADKLVKLLSDRATERFTLAW